MRKLRPGQQLQDEGSTGPQHCSPQSAYVSHDLVASLSPLTEQVQLGSQGHPVGPEYGQVPSTAGSKAPAPGGWPPAGAEEGQKTPPRGPWF